MKNHNFDIIYLPETFLDSAVLPPVVTSPQTATRY